MLPLLDVWIWRVCRRHERVQNARQVSTVPRQIRASKYNYTHVVPSALPRVSCSPATQSYIHSILYSDTRKKSIATGVFRTFPCDFRSTRCSRSPPTPRYIRIFRKLQWARSWMKKRTASVRVSPRPCERPNRTRMSQDVTLGAEDGSKKCCSALFQK